MIPYLDILEKHTSEELTHIIIKKLNINQQQDFIKDVLIGNNISFLKPFLTTGLQPWELVTFDINKQAVDFLISLGRFFLNQHHNIIEKIYAQNWKSKNELISRINYLISACQGGVSTTFLEQLALQSKTPLEEVSLTILSLKIKEINSDFDPFEYQKSIYFLEKPHFFVVTLYLFRKQNPSEGIYSLFSFQEDSLISRSFKKSSSTGILEMGKVYLVQSIYNLLNNADEASYDKFTNRIALFNIKWVKSLINEALQHPALEQIKQQIDSCKQKDVDQEKQFEAITKIERTFL